MQVTVIINKCRQCRHLGHSGAFTKGGAKPVCEHDSAVEEATALKACKGDDKYHWRHRVPKYPDRQDGMPSWCPLRRGHRY
jgi:hypothetical protein